jgi:DNA-binding XRE family transcriptional regulator
MDPAIRQETVMGSQILRPTSPGGNKQEQPWVVQGSWGKRIYPASVPSVFYTRICEELSVPYSSRKTRWNALSVVMKHSWIDDLGWVPDETLAGRLKRLRAFRGLTQELLAEAAQLPVNTLRQLEQGYRETPYWPTICALARGLQLPVTAFVGTEGWQPEAERG